METLAFIIQSISRHYANTHTHTRKHTHTDKIDHLVSWFFRFKGPEHLDQTAALPPPFTAPSPSSAQSPLTNCPCQARPNYTHPSLEGRLFRVTLHVYIYIIPGKKWAHPGNWLPTLHLWKRIFIDMKVIQSLQLSFVRLPVCPSDFNFRSPRDSSWFQINHFIRT